MLTQWRTETHKTVGEPALTETDTVHLSRSVIAMPRQRRHSLTNTHYSKRSGASLQRCDRAPSGLQSPFVQHRIGSRRRPGRWNRRSNVNAGRTFSGTRRDLERGAIDIEGTWTLVV